MGQRTFETRSLYLILAEKLFTLPMANEMLPLSAQFAGKYREIRQSRFPAPSWTGSLAILARAFHELPNQEFLEQV
jgi:hypothetical protein